MKKVAIGVDIGGTNTAYGIVDMEGNLLADSSIPTQAGNDQVETFIKTLCKAIDDMIKQFKNEIEVMGMGVGAPNGNYYKGTIEHAPNLQWKGIINFVDLIKVHFDLPTVVLTNDANAAAIGEMIYGAAKEMKNFVMITLGTGLGSGIIVNGDLVYGHDGFAGELGHIKVKEGGRLCGCGLEGCLETYVSATGIRRTVLELIAKYNGNSVLSNVCFEKLTSKAIYDAAVEGDKLALEAFDITGQTLGKALANATVFSSPEAFVLFGGLAQAGDLILKPTKKYMEENMFPAFKNKIKIIPSELSGAGAAVLGASALVWKELDK